MMHDLYMFIKGNCYKNSKEDKKLQRRIEEPSLPIPKLRETITTLKYSY